MNRRIWLKNTGLSASSVALAALIPHVVYSERNRFINEDFALRLHWNENPYGPSPYAQEAAQKMLSQVNHYPDSQLELLRQTLADKYNVTTDQVMVTAGSTEMLSVLGQYVGVKRKEILMSSSSFPTLAIFGSRTGARVKNVPLGTDLTLDLKAISEAISDQTELVFICNPNNPTSTDHSKTELIKFCSTVPSEVTICIDEAYIQFSRDGEEGSMIDQLSRFENLIVLRTFSKAYGMAGMRFGYSFGQPEFMNRLRQSLLGFGIENSIIGAAAAIAALKDDDHIKMVVSKNKEGRDILNRAFDRWGVKYAKSATNFTYVESKRFVPDIVERLRKENVLITKWPSMTNHIRVSIGRPEWLEEFVLKAQKHII